MSHFMVEQGFRAPSTGTISYRNLIPSWDRAYYLQGKFRFVEFTFIYVPDMINKQAEHKRYTKPALKFCLNSMYVIAWYSWAEIPLKRNDKRIYNFCADVPLNWITKPADWITIGILISPIWCWCLNIPGSLGQYHICWYHGPFCLQEAVSI